MVKLIELKTYKDWNTNSIYDYLKIGDRVDEEMYEHFLNVMPPIVNTSHILQVSEPYDFVDGKPTYMTFVKEDYFWVYKGNCHKGKY